MTVQIINGDCREVLRTLADGTVNCCVTSPPYWRQRDYGNPAQIGLEKTPEQFVAEMVAIFAEVRRVLTDDGTLWINIGDKWASAWHCNRRSVIGNGSLENGRRENRESLLTGSLKEKDLIGLPWMLAFALRDSGWYLRQCNIWAKPNGMPESVRDRSTVSHEYVFHLSKSPSYFYNSDASRTAPAPATETRLAQNVEAQIGSNRANGGGKTNGTMKAVTRNSEKQQGANLRSVWWISPAQYKGGHYAVMPEALAEICITAGCPPGGAVLDPFFGVGTTGLVADRLGMNCIGIELNPEYATEAKHRLVGDAPLLAQVTA